MLQIAPSGVARRPTLIYGAAFLTVAHLALIPILANYGARICPILGSAGFVFGCRYNGSFVIATLAITSLLNFAVWKWVLPHVHDPIAIQVFPLLSVISYLITFLVGAAYLNSYLHSLHVAPSVLERFNSALSYGAIILSVLQEHIAEWLVHDQVLAAQKSWKPSPRNHPIERMIHVILAQFKETKPAVAAAVIGGSLIKDSLHRLPNEVAGILDWIEMLGDELLKGFVLLLVWIVLVRLFQIFSSRQTTN